MLFPVCLNGPPVSVRREGNKALAGGPEGHCWLVRLGLTLAERWPDVRGELFGAGRLAELMCVEVD
jgi:hypothetical protein